MKNFCFLPFTSITVESNGAIRLCCATKHYLGKVSKGNTVSSAWKGKELAAIRNMIKADQRPEDCINCARDEAAGFSSLRLRNINFWRKRLKLNDNKMYGELVDFDNFKNNDIRDISLSFGNRCNLNCVMCSSEYSSSWFNFDKKFIFEGLDFRNNIKKFIKPAAVTNEFLDDILRHACTLNRLELKGGEPLYDKKCEYFLDKLSQVNPGVNISISTNGTIVTEEILKILSRFNNIHFTLSIDGTEKVYQWIRGIDLKIVKQNLNKLSVIDSIRSIGIHFTASAYNLWDINNFIDWTLRIKKHQKYNNKLRYTAFYQRVGQPYITAQNIPLIIRSKIAKKVENKLKSTKGNFRGTESLLNYLRSPDTSPSNQRNFLIWTKKCNQIRNKDIYQIVSGLNEARRFITRSLLIRNLI